MKSRMLASWLAVLSGIALAGDARADRGYDGRGYDGRGYARSEARHHVHGRPVHRYLDVDLYFGWPWYGPRYYRHYLDPVIITVPSEPVVYIERSTEQPSDDSEYWYYCPSSKTYYPYVQDCREDWLKVIPQPPSKR